MPKIGKGAYVPTSLVFDFTLTVNGTDYHIDKKSASSSVTNVYDYVREDKGWYLVVYANASLTFAKLKHLVDYCVVGGGAGGGGGTCGGSGISQGGKRGGNGGGGYYAEDTKMLSTDTAYAITIGAGGTRGAGAPGSRWADAGNGGDGNPTSIMRGAVEVLKANGGSGGQGATDDYPGGDGAGGDEQHCFNDDAMPVVSGKGKGQQVTSPNRGGGGGYGYFNYNPYGDPSSQQGVAGTAGVVVIRSSR